MFRRLSSRVKGRSFLRGNLGRKPGVELLECRQLLAADAQMLLDFSALEMDPSIYDPSSILVRFRDDAVADNRAVLSSRVSLANRAGGILAGTSAESLLSWQPELVRVRLPEGVDVPAALAAFRGDASVLYAEPDYLVHVAAVPDDPRYDEMWDMENTGQTGGKVDADMDAAGAWDVNTGSGSMVVAVIDTGVDYNHPDLAANIWTNPGEIPGDGIDNDGNGFVDDVHGYDFHNDDGDPIDDHSHGTHVAGTIGAVGNNGIGVTGVNWNVQIMALKFLGADGSGSSSNAIEAINYAVSMGARLSNNSWGGDPPSQSMFDAIDSARQAGHIFVAAAGNGNLLGIGQDNDATPFYPAGYELDNIIAVAATDHGDNLAGFSNYGATTVDLAAPGVNILSTVPGSGYGLNTGTSMASPHVAGATALVWDTHPEWTYDQVITQVLATVDPLPALAGLMVTGGRLNVATALDNPQPPPPPPPPGTLPIVEDFQDGQAQFFDVQSGNWNISGGRYDVSPTVDNDDLAGISTLRLDAPIPDDFEIRTLINADQGQVIFFGIVISDILTNGMIIFDYQGVDDFKFAGADMDANRWVIGHRDASGWTIDAQQSQSLSHGTDYVLRVVIEGGNQVTLHGGGVPVASHTFAESVVDGDAGVGARNSSTHFDNIVARAYVPVDAGTLPHSDNFDDGTADHLQEQTGTIAVAGGKLVVTPFAGGDGVGTLLLSDPLPANVETEFTFNADDATPDRFSNAFFIFDYHGPTDFKFAGAYVGIDEWLIGRRNGSGWVTDALVSAAIEPLTDYTIQVELLQDGRTTLSVDGVVQVTHQFADTLTDGPMGLGTKNAIARFDDWQVDDIATPPVPTPGSLPIDEDFEDGVADHFQVESGLAEVDAGRYRVTPFVGGDGISTILLADPLPGELEAEFVFNADPGSANRASNSFFIFDYHGPTDFKFAGAYVGIDEWLIGHRTAFDWVTDAHVGAPLDALTDYSVRVELSDDGLVTLSVGGVEQVSHQFASGLTDGAVGLGTKNALARFDNLSLAELALPPGTTPGELPLVEDFEDGVADHFVVESGQAAVTGGEYTLSADLGGDGISTLALSGPLPATVEAEFTFNADPASPSRSSNAFFIFDYHSPTDFKFAGAYVGIDEWLIGHRDIFGWVTNSHVSASIAEFTDYDVRVEVGQGGLVTLFAGGVQQVSHQFGDVLTDGAVGLGTKNALSRFDDVAVAELTDPSAPQPATLPFAEDFEDGDAEQLVLRTGAADVDQGKYLVTPDVGGDGISTVLLAEALPAEVEAEVTFNADDVSSGRASNAFFIFDYQSPIDFKFAGAYVGIDEWLIGHRDALGWVTDSFVSFTIDANTDYTMLLEVNQDGSVSLYADGVLQVARQYADDPTDGATGIGTKNAIARFDDYSLRETGSLQVVGMGPNGNSAATGGMDVVKFDFGGILSNGMKTRLTAAPESLGTASRAAGPWTVDDPKRTSDRPPLFDAKSKDRVFDEIADVSDSFDWALIAVDELAASPFV